MNIQLDPPPVRPLSPSQLARLRKRVMAKTRPTAEHSTRRWVAPVVAVGAVAAVVAGTLAITDKQPTDPGVAGTAQGSKPSGTPFHSNAVPAAGAPKVDLGPVPAAEVAALTWECQFPKETAPAKLLWSRKVRGITTTSTATVAVAVSAHPEGADNPGSIDKLGMRLCMNRTPASAALGAVGSTGIITDKVWKARPTPEQGLIALDTNGFTTTANNGTAQLWTIYRARTEIARVECRYVWKGKVGEWTEGLVDGGFAYTEVQAHGKFALGEHLKQEVRAFDAAGKPVQVTL